MYLISEVENLRANVRSGWFMVPKVASRSLHQAFKKMGLSASKERESVLCDKKINEFDFTFSFVRNPWDRIVSCYQQKIIEQKRIPHIPGLTPEEWDALNLQPPKPGTPQRKLWDLNKKKPTFRDFVIEITSQGESLDNRHWREMDKLVPDQINFIGKIENMEADFYKLCEKLKVDPMKLPKNNVSDRGSYIEYYDEETKRLISEKYEQDIERFNYKFGA